MDCLLGIDLGISSVNTVILSRTGHILISSAAHYQFDSPCPGYAEQDPQVWLDACTRTVVNVLRQADISGSDVRAISFSGQMQGVVMLDKDCRVIRPAILNCDTRSADQSIRLNTDISPEKRLELFHNPVCPGFMLTSLLWVRDNEPENYRRIAYVCSPKDYVRYRLTGVLSSDYSDASATLLFDIENNRWSDEIIAMTGLPRSVFPECSAATYVIGKISAEGSALTGLSSDTLAAAGGGRLIMANIGCGLVNRGDAGLNIGTGGQVSFQTDRPVSNPELNTNLFSSYASGRWAVYGASMSAGSCLKWWRNSTGNHSYDRIHGAVAKSSPGAGGILFYPYLNAERCPRMMPDIRSCFLGVNAASSYGDMTRAILEGVIYNLRRSAEVCEKLGHTADSYIVSGSAAHSDEWTQIMADVFNKPFRRVCGGEQACLGAAITAGVAAGFWGSVPEAAAAVVRYEDRVFLPDPENAEIYEGYYQVFRDTFPLFRENLRKLTDLRRRRKLE